MRNGVMEKGNCDLCGQGVLESELETTETWGTYSPGDGPFLAHPECALRSYMESDETFLLVVRPGVGA